MILFYWITCLYILYIYLLKILPDDHSVSLNRFLCRFNILMIYFTSNDHITYINILLLFEFILHMITSHFITLYINLLCRLNFSIGLEKHQNVLDLTCFHHINTSHHFSILNNYNFILIRLKHHFTEHHIIHI